MIRGIHVIHLFHRILFPVGYFLQRLNGLSNKAIIIFWMKYTVYMLILQVQLWN